MRQEFKTETGCSFISVVLATRTQLRAWTTVTQVLKREISYLLGILESGFNAGIEVLIRFYINIIVAKPNFSFLETLISQNRSKRSSSSSSESAKSSFSNITSCI